MRILRLTLENYRRFRAADLEFPDGVVGIVGRNGAGKTTLVEAIGWCLFGNEAARTGKDLLKRRGAPDDAACRVRLAFTLEGHTIEIERALQGTSQKPSATVAVDGMLVVRGGANSAAEATAYVERLLHMDRAAFFTSLVARQRELAALSDMKPAERRALVLRMLRVDAVEDAIRVARERKRAAREVVRALEAESGDEEALANRLAEARRALAEAGERVTQALAGQDLARRLADAARAKRDAERARHDRAVALEARIEAEERARIARGEEATRRRADLAAVAEAEKELAKLAPLAEAWEEARRHVEALALARERHVAAEKRATEAKRLSAEADALERQLVAEAGVAAELRDVENLLQSVRATLPKTREAQREADGAAREAQADIRRFEEEAARLGEKQEALKRLGPDGPCPTCTRPLGEHAPEILAGLSGERAAADARRRDAEARLDQARLRVAEAAKRVAELERRERELDLRVRALSEREAKRAALAERIARDRERLAIMLAELADRAPWDEAAYAAATARERDLARARDRAAQLRAQVARRGDLARQLALLVEDGARLEAVIAQLRADLVALAFDRGAFDVATADADKAERRLHAATAAVERARGDGARLEDEAKRAEADLDAARLAAKRLETERERVALLEALAGDRDSGVLVLFKEHLASRIRPLLAQHAGDLFRDLTDGRYAGLEVGPDYELQIHDDGEAFALDRFSGGEQDLANLCLRLAVGQVVAERAGSAGFHMLVLDEIFGSQDEGRKANVLAALAKLSGKFRQILLITHIEDVRDRVEHVLRVTDGADGAVAAFEN